MLFLPETEQLGVFLTVWHLSEIIFFENLPPVIPVHIKPAAVGFTEIEIIFKGHGAIKEDVVPHKDITPCIVIDGIVLHFLRPDVLKNILFC